MRMPKQTDGLVDRVRREREGRDPVLDISLRSMNEHVLTRKVDRAQRHLVRIFIRTYNTASNARDGFKSTRTCTPLRQRAPLFQSPQSACISFAGRAGVLYRVVCFPLITALGPVFTSSLSTSTYPRTSRVLRQNIIFLPSQDTQVLQKREFDKSMPPR